MALTNTYLITTKNLDSVINSIINAKAPERFTNKFLEDLGFKSSNDRLYIGIFKALGLINEAGEPTQRYFEFIDQTQTNIILAQAIQEAYEDLFNLKIDAQNMSNEEVKNKLKTLTQGQKSDKVLGLMASTFKALCALADWKKPSVQKNKTNKLSEEANEEKQTSKMQTTKDLVVPKHQLNTNLHYNIQIHLPETSNVAVYDAIFQSLKKHLI